MLSNEIGFLPVYIPFMVKIHPILHYYLGLYIAEFILPALTMCLRNMGTFR